VFQVMFYARKIDVADGSPRRGADSDSQVARIIMASLNNFLLAGDNPPGTAKLTMLE
jgi:hypothetical protein